MMVSRCISRIVLAISRGVLRGQHRQLEPVCGHCLQCTAGTSSVLTADSIARSFSSFFPRRVSDRSGKPGAVKKKASEAEGSADSVNHSIQETLQQSTEGDTGRATETSASSGRTTEKVSSATVQGKPDPRLMHKWLEMEDKSSTDSGGYIKLDKIGIDEKTIEEILSKEQQADERIRKYDPKKDTGRRNELPYFNVKSSKEDNKKGQAKTDGSESSHNDNENAESSAETNSEKSTEEKAQNIGRTKQEKKMDKETKSSPKDTDSNERAAARTTQPTVLWEGSRRNTSGDQSTSDAGGVGNLTEQLLDRDEADKRLEKEDLSQSEKWKDRSKGSREG